MSEEYNFTPEDLKDIERVAYDRIKYDLQNEREHGLDSDTAILYLTYLSSENLVKLSESLVEHSAELAKESKTLNRWTIVLAGTAIAMIVLAWQQANLWPFWLW